MRDALPDYICMMFVKPKIRIQRIKQKLVYAIPHYYMGVYFSGFMNVEECGGHD